MFEFFPILNIFGKPQSGKSQLGKAMKGFFTNSYKPINYEGETYPAHKQGVGTDGQLPCAFRRIQELYRVAQSGTAQINVGWRRARQDEGRRRGARERQLRRYPVRSGNADDRPALFTPYSPPSPSTRPLTHWRNAAASPTSWSLTARRLPPTMEVIAHRDRFVQDFPHFCELTRTEVVNCIARSGKDHFRPYVYELGCRPRILLDA